MKTVLHAAFLAVMLGAASAGYAQAPAASNPDEIIYPRGSAAAVPQSQSQAVAPVSGAFTPPSTSNGMAQVFGYIAVLAMLAGGAWLLVKRGSLPRPFARSEGRLKVVETRPLGNRQFLMVVEYEDAKMLLGVCQGRIDYLTPLAGHPLAAASIDEEDRDLPFNTVNPGARR